MSNGACAPAWTGIDSIIGVVIVTVRPPRAISHRAVFSSAKEDEAPTRKALTVTVSR